jgi:hypothetical protein
MRSSILETSDRIVLVMALEEFRNREESSWEDSFNELFARNTRGKEERVLVKQFENEFTLEVGCSMRLMKHIELLYDDADAEYKAKIARLDSLFGSLKTKKAAFVASLLASRTQAKELSSKFSDDQDGLRREILGRASALPCKSSNTTEQELQPAPTSTPLNYSVWNPGT